VLFFLNLQQKPPIYKIYETYSIFCCHKNSKSHASEVNFEVPIGIYLVRAAYCLVVDCSAQIEGDRLRQVLICALVTLFPSAINVLGYNT